MPHLLKTLLALTLGLYSPHLYSQTHVLFGERNLQESPTSVFFDRNGTVYPDWNITDSDLRQADASLDSFYVHHTDVFKEISSRYGCFFENYSPLNASRLQDAILYSIRQKIHQIYSDTLPLTFFIHGFRKSYVNVPGIFTSAIDYTILEETMHQWSRQPTGIIRVFWDGMYGAISFRPKRYKAMLNTFVQSQINAIHTGNSLRKLLTTLPNHQLNFISHSLGASVLCTALFDTASNNNPTPSQQKINICLIAPAIDGHIFKHYYERNTDVDYKTNDNYHLLILYNKKDFVLRKRDFIFGVFGPGPNKYGKTTLGCDYHHEVGKLNQRFKDDYPHSEIATVNMTQAIKKCHHLRCYCSGDHLKGLVQFIEK